MERKDQLVVSLSHGDRFGQYRVTARCGSAEYMDFFNPANELRRKVFAENTISKFNWEGTAEHLNAVNAVVLEELRRIEKDQLESEEVKLRRISGLQGDAPHVVVARPNRSRQVVRDCGRSRLGQESVDAGRSRKTNQR